jgi:hypothetical protein
MDSRYHDSPNILPELPLRGELLIRLLHASRRWMSNTNTRRKQLFLSFKRQHCTDNSQCSNLFKPTPRPGPHPCELGPNPPVISSFPILTGLPTMNFTLPTLPTANVTLPTVSL